MLQTLGGILAVLAFAALLVRDYRKARRLKQEAEGAVFRHLAAAIDAPVLHPPATAGTEILTGQVDGRRVEFRTVCDTLQMRKLPSLWLMISLPQPTGVTARLDLMMRAAGQASFSNFDRLPDTLRNPPGFPEEALIKTEVAANAPSPELLRPMLPAFLALRGKELLVTPTGVRMVIQIGEADRVRYGVFRQAHFAAAPLDPELVLPLVADLAGLLDRLKADVKKVQKERIRAHG